MPDDDDDLRRIFEREARLVPRTRVAGTALARIEPELRRAAFRRATLLTASAALALGGAAAVAGSLRSPGDEVSVRARPTPTQSVPGITAAPTAAPLRPPDGGTGPRVASDQSATRRPSMVVTAESDTSITPDAGDPADDGGSSSTDPPLAPVTAVPATEAVSASTAPATPVTTTTVGVPSTGPTTAATATQLVTYESQCGVVRADLATSPPTILEIVPADGYRAKVEDPDHGRITVHLVGRDPDCEIKVGEPGPEGGEPVEQRADTDDETTDDGTTDD